MFVFLRNDTLLEVYTIAANHSDAGSALPIWICWERTKGVASCLIANIDFNYTLDRVVRIVYPGVSIER